MRCVLTLNNYVIITLPFTDIPAFALLFGSRAAVMDSTHPFHCANLRLLFMAWTIITRLFSLFWRCEKLLWGVCHLQLLTPVSGLPWRRNCYPIWDQRKACRVSFLLYLCSTPLNTFFLLLLLYCYVSINNCQYDRYCQTCLQHSEVRFIYSQVLFTTTTPMSHLSHT